MRLCNFHLSKSGTALLGGTYLALNLVGGCGSTDESTGNGGSSSSGGGSAGTSNVAGGGGRAGGSSGAGGRAGNAGSEAGHDAGSEAGAGGVAGSGAAGSSDGGNHIDAGSADAPQPPGDAPLEAGSLECHTNRECTDRATVARAADASSDGGTLTVPAVCLKPEGRCVELLSSDCKTITGDYLDDNAILLGTLFTTSGPTGATNLQRQQSATLAFEEINAKGGLPPRAAGGPRRPVVALSCDAAVASRAAAHLVTELHVPAIVGPNTSQDTLDLSIGVSVSGGTVLMTPSAIASSIVDLQDDDLTWLMAPSDVQRGPLMIGQINALETQLKAARNKTTIKLGIIYRNDALGHGTRAALTSLQINGLSLTHPANASNVSVDPYQASAANHDALVAQYRAFAPDIIALAGTAEAITTIMRPLEETWSADAGIERPYYVTIDSAKVPELLVAAANADLRGRIRGTGVTSTTEAKLVFDAFRIAYANRYGSQPTASSTGPSYDAAYSIAYAIAAIRDLPVTGQNVAAGLRKLAGGSTVIEVGSTKILAAFQRLGGATADAGAAINVIGTFGPLEWDNKGAPVSATLEIWCIAAPGGTPTYATSGLLYDLKTQQYSGTYIQCQ